MSKLIDIILNWNNRRKLLKELCKDVKKKEEEAAELGLCGTRNTNWD